MAFEKGVVLEVISPFLVDGDMVMKGDMIEVPARDAKDLVARRKAQEPAGKGAKARTAQ